MLYEVKTIHKIALPLLAAILSQKGMQFIDTMMLGWLGPQALAAAALSLAIYISFMSFCYGTLSAVGIFIVRAKAANNPAHLTLHLQHGMYLALLLALPSMVLMWFAPHLLLAMGEDPRIVAHATQLLHTLIWGFPGVLLFYALREFICAFALTRMVMLVTLISIPLAFIANYVLIYGKYGLPALGMIGVGASGSVIMWFMFLALFIYSKKHSQLQAYFAVTSYKIQFNQIKQMLQLGCPSGAILILDTSMFVATTMMMGYFGANALAAHQVSVQVVSITYAIPSAITTAVALQVGYYVAQDMAQTKRFMTTGLALGLITAACVAVVLIIFPEWIVKLYIVDTPSNQASIQLGALLVKISAVFMCFDSLQLIINGILKGMKDTFTPMLISFGCYWLIGISSAYYFAFHTHIGVAGLWYGLTLGISSVACGLMLRLWYRLRTEESLSLATADGLA